MKKRVPGCLWASEKLLVGLRSGEALTLPASLVADLRAAGVNCVLSLLSRDQFRAAGADALLGPLNQIPGDSTIPDSKMVMNYSLWPEGDELPSARQMRLTLDEIDGLLPFGLTIFVHGAGIPERAVMAAACWLARDGSEKDSHADPEAARLDWLRHARGANGRRAPAASLNDAQRAFVQDWPAGRYAEPVLGVTELLDETEPYPTATVEYWLRTLPTVRVYPEGRPDRRFEVPVKDEKQISNGSVNLGLYDLHSGTWVGERTLRLLDGTVVVFVSPFRKLSR